VEGAVTVATVLPDAVAVPVIVAAVRAGIVRVVRVIVPAGSENARVVQAGPAALADRAATVAPVVDRRVIAAIGGKVNLPGSVDTKTAHRRRLLLRR
jgi:hypothetical protein